MKSTKKMNQTDYDNYITTELIPDLIEEYGMFDVLLIKDNKIQFAKTCKRCGDVILVGSSFDVYNELVKIDLETKIRYFEILTELDVFNYYDVLDCECYDEEDRDNYQDEEDELESTYLDLDEDYGDGNYEY